MPTKWSHHIHAKVEGFGNVGKIKIKVSLLSISKIIWYSSHRLSAKWILLFQQSKVKQSEAHGKIDTEVMFVCLVKGRNGDIETLTKLLIN